MNSRVKVYLDASVLNRPFDDQSLPRNRLETEAVIVILDQIGQGNMTMVSLSALRYENLKSPLVHRREYVTPIWLWPPSSSLRMKLFESGPGRLLHKGLLHWMRSTWPVQNEQKQTGFSRVTIVSFVKRNAGS